MGILSRFTDIISANVNLLLDKAENPAKMIDEYLRDMSDQLAEVKKETAGVIAEETRTKRMVDEGNAAVLQYADLAKKALTGGNEGDARVFLSKKQELEAAAASIQSAYAASHESANKMRQMHDKLVQDINTLNGRRQAIKAKVAVAETQSKISKLGASADKAQSNLGAFNRMEEKANRMLDEATAMDELNSTPVDEARALEEKYKGGLDDASVNTELAALKAELGLDK